MRVFSSLIFLLWTAQAFPLAITTVTGSSRYVTTGTPTIYGGLAGNDCSSAATSANSTCDSCEASQLTCTTQPLCACNSARIYPSLVLTINLKKNENNSNNAILLATDTSTGGTALPLITTNNGGGYVNVRWSDICSRISGVGATCTAGLTSANNTLTLKVVIDKDSNGALSNGEESVDVTIKLLAPDSTTYSVQGASNTEGFDSFRPYPGDGKIYIEDLNAVGGFPILTYGGKARALRVFMSDSSMADAAPGRPGLSPEDLEIIEDGANLKNNVVSGLTNGTTYAFRVAVVDDASNVLLFFPANPVGTGTCDATPLDASSCQYIAAPDEVRGLLSNDFNCFIATASYGSSFEPHLQLLRQFRNKVLLRYDWGVGAVKSYYKYGPIGARFIVEHSWLKPIVRVGLWPVIGFSWLALQLGLWPAVWLSLLALIAFAVPTTMWVRRRASRA